ncbi:MAG: flavin reductase [Bacteroidota bacterium]
MQKCFTLDDLQELDKYYRRHLLNSISGMKSANLVGTLSSHGVANLSMFSSVVHVGASPPLLGMVMRPLTVERQTYEYIKAQEGRYTLNHVHQKWIDSAHLCSAKFDRDTSEYDECKLTETYLDDFPIPFVGEATIRMGMQLVEEHPIASNGTIFLVGAVQSLHLDTALIRDDGNIDMSAAGAVAISGLETYYDVRPRAHFAFARPGQWPTNTLTG